MNTEEFTDVFINDEDTEDINVETTENNNEEINIFNKPNEIDFKEAKNRITRPKLTKYEKVRILGERTKQLTLSAKPMVNLEDTTLTAQEIANIEYEKNMIPFKIKRYLPNNTYEIWKFSELENY